MSQNNREIKWRKEIFLKIGCTDKNNVTKTKDLVLVGTRLELIEQIPTQRPSNLISRKMLFDVSRLKIERMPQVKS